MNKYQTKVSPSVLFEMWTPLLHKNCSWTKTNAHVSSNITTPDTKNTALSEKEIDKVKSKFNNFGLFSPKWDFLGKK